MGKEINSYDLSRNWFNFCFENPEKISPNHTAIYFFAIEHCNRLGWKEKFGFPTQMAMDAIGIKKHQTYIKYFYDLVDWGFFKLVQRAKNQYSSNIITLVSAVPKKGKALDKAIIKHMAKQTESTGQSTGQSIGQSKDSILKQETIEQQTNKQEEEEKPKAKKFSPPTQSEVISYFLEKGYTQEAACKAFDYYDVANWTDSTGKKIKNWKQKMIAVWFEEKNKAGYRNPNQPPKRVTPDPPPFVSCIKSPEDLKY